MYGSAANAAYKHMRLRKDRKQILESLQRMGVVEVSDQTSQDAVFHKVDVETQQDILEKQLSRVNEAQRILNERVPKKQSWHIFMQIKM